MDSSLNHFRASQGRRNQRQEKKGRKYNAKVAAAMRAEYKSQLKQSDFSEEAKLALRKRLIEQQKKRRTKNLVTLIILALIVTGIFTFVLRYL